MGAALAVMPVERSQAAQPSDKAISDVSRYCQACWRNARLHPDAWSDATQDVLARLLTTVEPSRWPTMLQKESADHREFVRAIDAVKKRNQRGRKFGTLVDDVRDERSMPESARHEWREELNKAVVETLSERQRRIIQLSSAGWTIPEIADDLETSVSRVSDEKYKAIQKLRKHLRVDEM
jgi:RNA polymerase sigma factor (sigma-70 family)